MPAILLVMNCPECKKPGAYIGLLWVHCKNVSCKYYDAIYATRKDLTQSEKLILLRGLVMESHDKLNR